MLFMAVFIAVDTYVFFAIKNTLKSNKYKKIYLMAYALGALLSYVGIYHMYGKYQEKPLNADLWSNLLVGYFFSFFAFRLVLMLIFLLEDIVRLLTFVVNYIKKLIRHNQNNSQKLPGRRKFIRQAGLTIAAIPFTSMIYGITKGKYDFKVNKIKLKFKNLPKSFNGYKIVQLSDIHTGSFDSKLAVQEGVELVNQQDPDVILFTGDLVNNDSKEALPFIEDFKKLKAKDGLYSVLGNHDYGDYKKWSSAEAKEQNLERLFTYQEQMGFKLLNNDHHIVQKGQDSIGIFGVENWGKPPFPQKGDLDTALDGSDTVPFKILMSHDPTHWAKKVVPHQEQFDITLSGHTHGMQFGIEIPGFKWSPIKYLYPQWAGLYQKSNEYLYVNRGFGFLGFPGRAGIRPEITVIELEQLT